MDVEDDHSYVVENIIVHNCMWGCNKFCGETIEPEPFGMCID